MYSLYWLSRSRTSSLRRSSAESSSVITSPIRSMISSGVEVSMTYMLSNPLWGWILDRAGLRRGMAAAVAWWTAASMAHAFAGGFWSFAVARAALGFGEGATFPGGLRTVVQTLGPGQRGRGLA